MTGKEWMELYEWEDDMILQMLRKRRERKAAQASQAGTGTATTSPTENPQSSLSLPKA